MASGPSGVAPDAAGGPIRGLIARKRDGASLSAGDIRSLVDAYLDGEVADEQMAALLMAGTIRGFSQEEAAALTDALVASGQVIELGDLGGPTIDKHSSGGVGDTTTLIVAPLLAACGMRVAKLAGRALGHTGGTIDKLESIPGMRVELTADRIREQVAEVGVAVSAASDELAPADKRLYGLRDRTATVASPALIASSIMSKKLACGATHIVLDIKAGGGALVASPGGGGPGELATATELAELCVAIGNAHNRRTAALISDMSQPLGPAIGNALEVAAAVEVLRNEHGGLRGEARSAGGGRLRGEARSAGGGRLRELSLELATAGLQLSGVGRPEAADRARMALESGRALEVFARFVAAQGGDSRLVEDPEGVLPTAQVVRAWKPPAGVVVGIDCRGLGELARELAGDGRAAPPDPAAGLRLDVELGSELDGGPAGWVHAADEQAAATAMGRLGELVRIDPDGEAPEPSPLVHRRIGLGEN